MTLFIFGHRSGVNGFWVFVVWKLELLDAASRLVLLKISSGNNCTVGIQNLVNYFLYQMTTNVAEQVNVVKFRKLLQKFSCSRSKSNIELSIHAPDSVQKVISPEISF